jgi:outer membrane lipoprotein-sorting protein
MRAALLLAGMLMPALLQARQAPPVPAAPNAEELLTAADRLRHPFPNFTVDMAVAMGGCEQRWRVRVRENGDARVEGRSEKEQGRTILTKGDEVWLILPGAKRPLKVSPQQRLLGPASGGDLARTRFRDDYAVASLHQDALDGRPVWRLELKAKRPALTFQRATLIMDAATRHPLRADFLFSSGKIAKTAVYLPGAQAAGRAVLRGMEIRDPRGPTAAISFSGWTQGPHDPALFDLPEAK